MADAHIIVEITSVVALAHAFCTAFPLFHAQTDEGLVLGRNWSRFLALFVDACM